MKNILLLLFLGTFLVSCSGQGNRNKLEWKKFASKEAGFSVSVPCSLNENVEAVEGKQRPAKIYKYDCKNNDFAIVVNLTEYFSENGKNEAFRSLPSKVEDLKSIFHNVTSVEGKEFTKDGNSGITAQYQLSSGDRVKDIILINERGIYEVTIYVPRKEKQVDVDFENYFVSLSKPIIDSFEIGKGL